MTGVMQQAMIDDDAKQLREWMKIASAVEELVASINKAADALDGGKGTT